RDGRAVPRVAEVEVARAAIDRVVHMLFAQHRADRRVARAQALAERDDVRLDRQLLVGEPAPGPAHPGHDLVEADEEAVLLAALSQPTPELGRRRISRSRGAADRLAEERGHAVRACLLEPRVELVQHPYAMPD